MENILLDSNFKDICIIKINRPKVLNALNRDTIEEFYEAIDIVSNDDGIKAVIITGTGDRSFCAGGDIRYVVGIDPIDAEEFATLVHNLLNKIENLDKPVIAAINGYALGGGCQLALACDIRIASDNAKLGQPEVNMGITPGWGGTQRLTRIVGMAKSKELIYTGKTINANEAEKIGLINKVVKLTKQEKEGTLNQNILTETTTKVTDLKDLQQQEKHQSIELSRILNRKLIDESLSFTKEIVKNSYNAVKVSKTAINKGMDVDIETGLCLEIYGMALSFTHKDRQKMMFDFLNKKR
ncbi:MAG: enoyl-CoA hydratase-related protein [Thermoproteota archaeon]|nr:enoyl-CoA hydratase-related protein [Thermoproteota archaeon]